MAELRSPCWRGGSPGGDDSGSLDLIDLPDSPIEPGASDARGGAGHGLYNPCSEPEPPEEQQSGWLHGPNGTQVLPPLHNADLHMYTSAQSLLDAYSRTPPHMSPRKHDWACGPVLTFASDFDDAVADAAEDMRDDEVMRSSGDMGASMPVPGCSRFLAPFTCCSVFKALAFPPHGTKALSFETPRAAFDGARSVTDDVSTKLAQDLAHKLEQRRAWERAALSHSPPLDPAANAVAHHSSHAEVRIPANENSWVLKRADVLPDNKSHSTAPVLITAARDGCRERGNDVVPDPPETRRRGDDAAIRRVSSINRTASPPRTNFTREAAQVPTSTHSSDMIKVHLLEAKMLASRKLGGLPDPCAWISLHHRSKATWQDGGRSEGGEGGCQVSAMDMKAQHSMVPHFKSSTVTQSQDPTWDDTVNLSMAYQSTTVAANGIQHESATLEPLGGKSINLFLTVHDDGVKKCDFLGQAAVVDILPGITIDRWVTLQRRDGNPQMENFGGRVSSVRIKIEYVAPTRKEYISPTRKVETKQNRMSPPPVSSFRGSRVLQPVQAAFRRRKAQAAFRLTVLQSRLSAMELRDSNLQRNRDTERSKQASFVNIDADIVASSSDYCQDPAKHDPTRMQQDGRLDLMDYALRDRSILGQAEALANLGLGLLNDRDEFREQSLQYLFESWNLLQTMKPLQLQQDRAQSIIQRMARSGAFDARHDVSSQLAAISRRSTIFNNERKWAPVRCPLPIHPYAAHDQEKPSTAEHKENVSFQNIAADTSWKVFPRTFDEEASSTHSPLKLERTYRSFCKKTAARTDTYKKLREMPAREAAEVLRRKMGLWPFPASTPSLHPTFRPISSGSVTSDGNARNWQANMLDLGDASDAESTDDARDRAQATEATWGGIQRGQIALSALIASCDEFKKGSQHQGRSQETARVIPAVKSLPSQNDMQMYLSKGQGTHRDMSRIDAEQVDRLSTSRLATLEAQLKALDNL